MCSELLDTSSHVYSSKCISIFFESDVKSPALDRPGLKLKSGIKSSPEARDFQGWKCFEARNVPKTLGLEMSWPCFVPRRDWELNGVRVIGHFCSAITPNILAIFEHLFDRLKYCHLICLLLRIFIFYFCSYL